MYIKLSVFDFDGTLIDTPFPSEKNKIKWANHYDMEEWPYLGWWGRPESLDMEVWGMEPISNTIKDYKTELKNKNTMTVMLTGRVKKQSPHVMKIINKYDLVFDKYLFNRGGETSSDKISQMENILNEYPTIKDVEMWDDRREHFGVFNEWGEKLVKDGIIESFKLNEVL